MPNAYMKYKNSLEVLIENYSILYIRLIFIHSNNKFNFCLALFCVRESVNIILVNPLIRVYKTYINELIWGYQNNCCFQNRRDILFDYQFFFEYACIELPFRVFNFQLYWTYRHPILFEKVQYVLLLFCWLQKAIHIVL